MREDRAGARLPRRQLSVDRRARAGDAAADQRLQPARDQRARRQHLGQLLVAVLQAAALGRHDHGARPVHRRADDLRDAGRRARLHAAAVADQPLVDRAVPAQQHASDRSTQTRRSMRACASFDASIEQMLWPEKRDARRGARRQGARRDRPHDGAQRGHASRPAIVPDAAAAAARAAAPLAAAAVRRGRRHRRSARSRPGVPVNLLANICGRCAESDDPVERLQHVEQAGRAAGPAQARSARRCRQARPTRSCAQNSPICEGRCWS